jgi:glycosyltransferase involved in cell wall biosynthesis
MTQNFPNPDNSNPYISIIIPLYNSEKTIEKCLTAVFNSTFQNLEVLVVDDDSKDNSVTIAESFPCRVLKLSYNQGPSVARNWGARNAKGDVLLFIDSDIVIQRDTLSLFVDSLKSYSAVFGIYTKKPGTDGLLSLYQNFYAHKSIRETKELTSMLYSYCVGIKRDVFNEAGGFDERWLRATFEDVELGLRVTENGHQIYLNKKIEVVHHPKFTIKRFIKNYFYKSLDLSKFMLSKKRLTLNNEGWTSRKNMISFLAGLSVSPFSILSFFSAWAILPFVISMVIFLTLNSDFYKFILKEKPLGLPNAIVLNLMVQIISALGIITGIANHLLKSTLTTPHHR